MIMMKKKKIITCITVATSEMLLSPNILGGDHEIM
jgi:hypothetical protein